MELEIMSQSKAEGIEREAGNGRTLRLGVSEVLVVVGLLGGGTAWVTNIALAQGRHENRLTNVEHAAESVRIDVRTVLDTMRENRERLVRLETLLQGK